VTVSGPGRDLHSGVFGGTVHEPMTDLVILLSKLVTPDGKILIPGINDDVAELTGTLNKDLFVYLFILLLLYLFANSNNNSR
jgi:hypothetical protein